MNDDERMQIIEALLWGEIPEGELFEVARRQLGFRIYSEEAFEFFGQALGLVEPGQNIRHPGSVPASARIH
jgi:hypothetical protein